MVQLNRVRTGFLGLKGLPGVCTMYFTDVTTVIASLQEFWGQLAGLFPAPMTIQIATIGDIIESTTGALVGQWNLPAVSAIPALGQTVYSAPSGAVVDWLTATILDGHRVRGRSFLVPLSTNEYDSQGTILNATVDGLGLRSAALVTAEANKFVVWHRPYPGRAALPPVGTKPGKPARPATLGGVAVITGSRVPDMAVVLRSRRD